MTAKELYDKHGPGVWWAHIELKPNKDFRPLGISENGKRIIGENSNGVSHDMSINCDAFTIYKEPKKSVVRWQWAYRDFGLSTSSSPKWSVAIRFYSEDEAASYFKVATKKLEYTRTEFKE